MLPSLAGTAFGELPPQVSEDRALTCCMDVCRMSLQGMQSQAGDPMGSTMAKPQHLTAVFVKPDGNGLFCPAFV